MSEIPVVEILGGGAFALLVIKEFRMWGKTVLEQKRAKNGDLMEGLKRDTNGNICNKHTGQILVNANEITNVKEVLKETRLDNKKEHDQMHRDNQAEHKEIKFLIIDNGKKT